MAQGGAPGSEALKRSDDLRDLLQKQQSSNNTYAAMCAAPAVVLEAHGLLKGKKATAHPGFVDRLSDSRCANESADARHHCLLCLNMAITNNSRSRQSSKACSSVQFWESACSPHSM